MDFLTYLLLISPFTISFLSSVLLAEMFIVCFYTRRWEDKASIIIPFAFDALYLWIGIFNPPIELARTSLRLVLGFTIGIAIVIEYSYARYLMKKGVKNK